MSLYQELQTNLALLQVACHKPALEKVRQDLQMGVLVLLEQLLWLHPSAEMHVEQLRGLWQRVPDAVHAD